MRKALIGILMAATMATPLAAQENGRNWRHGGEARSERSEGRGGGWRQQQQQQQQQAAPQQQAQQNYAAPQRQQWQGQRQQWQGNGNQNWQGRGNWQRGGDDRRQAYERQVQESREASRRSAEGVIPSYQRQAERNQQRYEQRLQRDYRQDRYRDDRRNDSRRWNNEWRGDRDGGRSWNWSRNWRNDNRYDWQRYRYSNRNAFRVGPYYAPYRGYGYNRLNIGIYLDSLFFGRNYWLDDPYSYHLPPSPPGTQWIRYYNDVVLVDVYSGEVIDVIYDFFW